MQIGKESPNKPDRSKSPIKVYSIEEVLDNQSLRDFWNDSIAIPPYIKPKVVVKFAPLHYRIGGMTTKIENGIYFIQINPAWDLNTAQRTMLHEYVHVLQFHRGMLIEGPGNIVIWKGGFYTWSIPWHQRPWEIHAEKLTDKLFVSEVDK